MTFLLRAKSATFEGPRPSDATLSKHRNWIERLCKKLKHWRRLATRYDHKTTHSLAFLYLAALPLWVP